MRARQKPVRVGDADRDAVLAQLGEHYAAGRMPLGELHVRQDRALAAVTAAQLAGLVNDLPALRLTRQPRHRPDRRPSSPRRPLVGAAAIVAALTLGGGSLAYVASAAPAADPPTCVATGAQAPVTGECPVPSLDQQAILAASATADDAAQSAAQAADGAAEHSALRTLSDQARAGAAETDRAVADAQEAVTASPDSPATRAALHAAAQRARHGAATAVSAAEAAGRGLFQSTAG